MQAVGHSVQTNWQSSVGPNNLRGKKIKVVGTLKSGVLKQGQNYTHISNYQPQAHQIKEVLNTSAPICISSYLQQPPPDPDSYAASKPTSTKQALNSTVSLFNSAPRSNTLNV